MAHQYEVDFERVDKIINCESGYRHEGIYGDKGKAYGALQFHKSTFEGYKKKYGKTWLEYTKFEDQIELGMMMMARDEWRHWTCDRL